jgi:SAM-dependent methyltransferase
MTMTDLGASAHPLHASTCAACGGALERHFEKVRDPQTLEWFSILECERCGLGHTDPQPADLTPYYGARYHGGRHSFTDAWCIARRLRFLRQAHPEPKKLLDVGCGDGRFLEAARGKGWRGFGTEMNPEPPRARGFVVETSVDAAGKHGPFDVISYWHSLEHFRDPRAAVEGAAKLLAPGGTLLIAVPDAGGIQAKAAGAHWFHLDVPRHLFHFTRGSLTQLLERVGLGVKRSWHQELEIDVFGWLQSPLNKFTQTPNALFDTLTGRPTPAPKLAVGRDFAVATAFGPLAVAATLASTALGRGGTLVVAASRQ